MARVRLRLPVEIEVPDSAAKVAGAALDLAAAIVDSAAVDAAKKLGATVREAWKRRAPRPR